MFASLKVNPQKTMLSVDLTAPVTSSVFVPYRFNNLVRSMSLQWLYGAASVVTIARRIMHINVNLSVHFTFVISVIHGQDSCFGLTWQKFLLQKEALKSFKNAIHLNCMQNFLGIASLLCYHQILASSLCRIEKNSYWISVNLRVLEIVN